MGEKPISSGIDNNSEINSSLNINKEDILILLRESIDILKIKLSNLKDGEAIKIMLFKNQIKELNKIKNRYKKLKRGGITKVAKDELSSIFKKINTKIGEGNKIGKIRDNSLDKIKEKLKEEKKYRKFIKKHIDFHGIRESGLDGEDEAIKKFYDYFTIKYINLLDNNIAIKATHKNFKRLNGLNISKEDLDKIIERVIKKLINEDLDLKLENITVNIGNKKETINLSEIKGEILDKIIDRKLNEIKEKGNFKEKRENYKKKQLKKLKITFSRSKRPYEKTDSTPENYIKNLKESRKKAIDMAKNLIENNYITKEELRETNYILFLELYSLDKETKEVGLTLINTYLKDFKVRRREEDGGNLIINGDFLNTYKGDILENLRYFSLLFTEIESANGNPLNQNLNGSGAMGLYQFKNNDGGYTTQYFKNKLWVNERDISKKERNQYKKRENIRLTNSYETALNKIVILLNKLKKHPDENKKSITILEKLFLKATGYTEIKKIKEKLDGKTPLQLTSQEQTILFLVNSFSNQRKITNGIGTKVGIKDFMGLVLTGNIWGTKQGYKIFHHTNPNEATLKLIDRSVVMHKNKFKYIKPKQ